MPNEEKQTSSATVTGNVLVDYIADRCGDLVCPACKSEEPPLIHAHSAEGAAHVIIWPHYPTSPALKAFHLATCSHCGFAWNFDASMVSRWARNLDKDSGEGDNANK